MHDAANTQYVGKSRCQISRSVSEVLSWWNVGVEEPRRSQTWRVSAKLRPWLRTRVQRPKVWKVIKKNIDSHRVAFPLQWSDC